MTGLRREVARVFRPLLAPARYKGAHGGRGSGKSHFFAEQAAIECLTQPGSRIVCIREVQKSLAQSVRQLIADKISALGIGRYFEIQEAQIRAPGDGLILFQGMQNHTAESIKSLEGYRVAYIEEAQSLSQRSLDLLRPTIRAPNSEIWAAWNPDSEDDPIDRFFRGGAKPPGSLCVEANWADNPWFPPELRAEMEYDYATEPEKAAHIWGGGYNIIAEGAYFARLIAEADRDGRIGDFPYDEARPVKTAWDLGIDDYTAIWFLQEGYRDGAPRVRVIDYYETSGDGADLIVGAAIKPKGYRYQAHHLPHDVMQREWGAGGRSRFATLSALGLAPILAGVNLGANAAEERVNAVRALLPICEFNDTPAVRLGLKRLRGYRRKWNESLRTFQGPLHDECSHGADAFGEYAVNSPLVKAAKPQTRGKPDDYKPVRRTDATQDLGRV